MGMFDMKDEHVAEWRQKCRDLVADHVNGEECSRRPVFARAAPRPATPPRRRRWAGSSTPGSRLGDEVAAWEREGLKANADRGSSLTSLTLEPPDGDKATLVGISVKDDPVSQELIAVLQGASA